MRGMCLFLVWQLRIMQAVPGSEAVLLCKVMWGSRSLLAYCPAISWMLYTVRADSLPTVCIHTIGRVLSKEKKDANGVSTSKSSRGQKHSL